MIAGTRYLEIELVKKKNTVATDSADISFTGTASGQDVAQPIIKVNAHATDIAGFAGDTCGLGKRSN